MENGEESLAINLLHQCVANYAGGQAPNRLWGTNFRYRPLWPDKLEIEFELPIPAEVASILGWNKLPQGELVPSLNESEISDTGVGGPSPVVGDIPAPEGSPRIDEIVPPLYNTLTNPDDTIVEESTFPGLGENPDKESPATSDSAVKQSARETPVIPVAAAAQQKKDKTSSDGSNLQSVSSAFANLATRLNKPAIAHSDGRFPVYIILSTRAGLEKQYGQQSMTVIDEEIKKLADTISRRVGMRGLVFYPDDPEITNTLGINRIDSIDPAKIKNAVGDIDRLLAKKGEMIGALLIVGGPDVVPFHELANPTEDADATVASDNPYAVLDSNYFIPEWPVGRIPGEKGQDAGLLLEQIRNIRNYHGLFASPKTINLTQVFSGIFDLFQKLFGNQANLNTGEITTSSTSPSSSLGITASVWRRSSLSVFKPIGDSTDMFISPPETSGSINTDKVASSQLGYFNLHGLTDSPNWYGQRETTDTTTTEYPIAISPKDLAKNDSGPQVIYSESCYGAYIFDKSEDESMALKFISLGAKAFVGSTTIAYGSVNTPLIGADLLGFQFWKSLREGFTAGEALMQAKVEMVRELNKRQGFLDGDDQKTLISFVLYGDPLGGALEKTKKAKKIFRLIPQPQVKTFDEDKENPEPRAVSEQELNEVRQIVASYLPDLDNADILVKKQRFLQAADSRTALNHLEKKEIGVDALKHVVVTITKKVQTNTHMHHHYARATLDPQGKLVKLAISR
jgi:hypothetical protein